MNTIFKRFKDYNLVCLTVLGKKYGSGHYYRCKELIKSNYNKNFIFLIENSFKDKNVINLERFDIDIIFNQIKSTGLIKKKIAFIIDLSNSHFFRKNNINKIDILIHNLLKFNIKTIIIDSLNDENLFLKIKNPIDSLIIPYITNNKKKYINYKKCKNFYISHKYFLLNKYLKKINRNKNINFKNDTCLISMGGSADNIYGYYLGKQLAKENENIIFYVFIKSDLVKKIKLNNSLKNLKIMQFSNLFYFYLSKCNILISNSGLTKYEASYLYKPVIRIYMNKTQKNLDKYFYKINKTKSFMYKDKQKMFKYFKNLIGQALKMNKIKQNLIESFR